MLVPIRYGDTVVMYKETPGRQPSRTSPGYVGYKSTLKSGLHAPQSTDIAYSMSHSAKMQLSALMSEYVTVLYTLVMSNVSPPSTLRERQRDRTREDIQAAAFSLFAENGFENTTVAAISARAGIAVRTFFRYFPTKEDVVFGDHADTVARLRDALEATASDDPPMRRVRQAVLAVQQPGQHRDREIMRARLIAEAPSLRARSHQLIEHFEEVLAGALAGELGPEAGAEARAMIIAGAVFGALRGARRAASTFPHPDPQRLVDTAFTIVEDGASEQFRHR